jgi:molybdenum cofactor cytidylyltransferase
MGRLKQLLPFRGKTLIEHAVTQAAEADFDPIAVVLGANSLAVREALLGTNALIVENLHWQSGMGSSIAAGVQGLEASGANPEAIAILLADQPLVTAEHLKQMVSLLSQSTANVVAARYGEALGVPAIFKRDLFPRLASLTGEAGARSLLRESDQHVIAFGLPEAATDLDTPDDFAALGH